MTSLDFKGLWGSVVAFFIAILSGLGVGSGGLLVIWLTMVQGMDAIGARGLNLLFFVFSASAALVFHILRKRLRYRLVIFMSLCAAVGTLAGSFIGAYISASALRKFFGYMLIVSGVYTVVGKLLAEQKVSEHRHTKKQQNSSSREYK